MWKVRETVVCILFVCVLVSYHCFSSTVATPAIGFTRVPEHVILVGQALNLTCTVSLDASVNTSVTVSAMWSRRVDLATPFTMVTSGVYESVLEFDELEMSDSGAYTCTASVLPDPIDETYITASGTGEGTFDITFGKYTEYEWGLLRLAPTSLTCTCTISKLLKLYT